MSISRLTTRLLIGGLFVGHGTQKLVGAFGGPGLQGTEQFMRSLELHPAKAHAIAAGVTETAGGAALAAGLATPLAASGLIGTMVTAIRTVHLKNGPWNSDGGFEYNAVLIAALVGIAELGPGKVSLDALRGKERTGLGWGLLSLGLGAAASTALLQFGGKRPATAPAPAPVEPEPDLA